MKDPLEYNRISDKYKFKILITEPESIFIIEHQGFDRVIINRYSSMASWGSNWSVKDSSRNFYFSIAEYPEKYWFAVPETDMTYEVKLMIKIFRELKLCTITKAINGITHFNFIVKQ